MAPSDSAFAKRFWSKVDKSADAHKCWLWTAGRNRKNARYSYGQFRIANGEPLAAAHRLAWELKHGPIPQGLCVCHRCDVPVCVNPAHLFLGSASDNIRDAVQKGHTPGPRRGSTFRNLTRTEVLQVRTSPLTQEILAKQLGVTVATISNARRRHTHRLV